MREMYQWLRRLLATMLPQIEHITGTHPEDEQQVEGWFEQLLGRFAERGLDTPAKQKNYLVDVRNAIKALDPEHFALRVVNFDAATYTRINLAAEDRTDARNQQQRLLPEPEAIVARARELLAAKGWPEIAVGLAVTTGRRISELLSAETRFEPVSAWSVQFHGQRKHRGDQGSFAYEIPTLAPAQEVLDAWERLRVMTGSVPLSPQKINARFGDKANRAAEKHFADLVPLRANKDALYLHLYRAIYATIAVHWFCPPRINADVYRAEIQGHRRILEVGSSEMRRSLASQRHYSDYHVADASGQNIDGRQGIKLGHLPGLELLAAFQNVPEPSTKVPPTGDGPEPSRLLSPDPALELDFQEPVSTMAIRPTKRSPAERPVTYRVYPADRTRLDALKLDPKESQAACVRRLLERDGTAQAQGDQHTRETEKLREESQHLQAQLDQAAGELQNTSAALADREGELARLRAAAAQASTRPANQDGASQRTKLITFCRDLLELALSPEAAASPTLQERLLALAASAVAPPPSGAAALDGGALPAPPSAQPAAKPAQAANDPEPLDEGSGNQAEQSARADDPPTSGQTDTLPTPAKRTAPASLLVVSAGRSGSAQAKIEQAVAAVMRHNDAEPDRGKKWEINQGLAFAMTGCFRGALKKYFDEHAPAITEHNAKHGLTAGHNNWHGRRGVKIGDVVRLD